MYKYRWVWKWRQAREQRNKPEVRWRTGCMCLTVNLARLPTTVHVRVCTEQKKKNKEQQKKSASIFLPARFMSTEQANCVGISPSVGLVCLDLFVCLSVCAWRACVAPRRELMAASSRRARRCLRPCPSQRHQTGRALMWRWPPSAAPPRRCNPSPGCPRCAGLPKRSKIRLSDTSDSSTL